MNSVHTGGGGGGGGGAGGGGSLITIHKEKNTFSHFTWKIN